MNLQQLEFYCNQLYTNKIQQIQYFSFQQCQEILQSSTNQFAQLHALKSLQQFISENCKLPNTIKANSFSFAQLNAAAFPNSNLNQQGMKQNNQNMTSLMSAENNNNINNNQQQT